MIVFDGWYTVELILVDLGKVLFGHFFLLGQGMAILAIFG